MNQLYIYIYPHISSPLHLPPTPLGGHKTRSWSPCAMWLLPTSYIFYWNSFTFNWVIYLFVVEFQEFFIYSRYKSLIRSMICKYFLSFWGLSFCFPGAIFFCSIPWSSLHDLRISFIHPFHSTAHWGKSQVLIDLLSQLVSRRIFCGVNQLDWRPTREYVFFIG